MASCAGYIMKHLGHTAQVGDRLVTLYGTLQVENTAQVRITQMVMAPHPAPPEENESGSA